MNVLGALVCWLAALLPLQQEKKLPVPDPGDQKIAEKLVRDIFKDDYAKRGPADRVALARKLVEQGLQTKDDAAARFVQFREAQELAAQAGNVEVALCAIGELSKEFQIDAAAMRNQALTTVAQNAKTPEEFKALAESSLLLAEEALRADEFDSAAKALTSASALAKKAKELPLVARIDARSRETSDLKARFDRVQKARETLAATPDDPQACQLVGWFYGAGKGDWEKGLPLLAAGADATLKTLAALDLSHPAAPLEQSTLGDKWWDQAEKLRSSERDKVRNRAVHWYEQSLAGLSGLPKVKVEKRLAELRAERLAREGWVDITDPSFFGQPGRKGDPIQFLETTKQNTWLKAGKFPPGDFEAFSIRVTFESADMKGEVRIEFEGVLHEVRLYKDMFTSFSRKEELGRFDLDFSAKLPPKRETTITGIYQSGEIVFFLDGKEAGRSKSPQKVLTTLAITEFGGQVKFDEIRLKRKQ